MEAQKLENEASPSEVFQFVCFKLADEEYGLDISLVREVIRVPHITYVPQMPDFNLGIINIRGAIIPVVDLRKKLGLAEKEVDNKTKMIVAIDDQSMLSFLVDEILENIKLTPDQIDPAPQVKMKIDSKCIKGIGKLENRMISLLNLKKIHEDLQEDIKSFS